MASEDISWEDARLMSEELEGMFTDGQDIASMKKVKELQDRLSQLTAKEEGKLQSIIRSLSNNCDAIRAQVNEHNMAQHLEKMEQLLAEKTAIENEIAPLEQEEESTNNRMETLAERLRTLDKKIKKLKADTPKLMQRLENSYSLYFSISNILWDSDETKLAGVIDCKRQNKLKEFDVSDMDSFDAANKLWDIISLRG